MTEVKWKESIMADNFTLKCADSMSIDPLHEKYEIETDVTNLLTQLRLTNYQIDNIIVTNSENFGINLNFISSSNGDIISYIKFNTNLLSDCTFNKMVNGLTNYTITGGPSNTHIDYIEMKIVDNGMYFSNPNAENNFSTNYHKEFYTKDNGDGTYSRLVPTQAGGWTEQAYIEDAYTSNFNNTLVLYLVTIAYDITNQWYSSLNYQYFKWDNNKLVLEKQYGGTDKTFTINKNALTYTYSNYEITINDNNEIISMTWDMQLYNAIYDNYSEVYHMTLTAGNTSIDFPQV